MKVLRLRIQHQKDIQILLFTSRWQNSVKSNTMTLLHRLLNHIQIWSTVTMQRFVGPTRPLAKVEEGLLQTVGYHMKLANLSDHIHSL